MKAGKLSSVLKHPITPTYHPYRKFNLQRNNFYNMKKDTFFGITQGLMWSFLAMKMGYVFSNWQYWIISVTGLVIWTIIYHKWCDD